MPLMVYYLVFGHFPRFFFRMHLNPEKRLTGPQDRGKSQKLRRRRFLGGGVSCFPRLWLVPMSPAFGLHRETIMDDELKDDDLKKDVQPYPVELWPESERRGEGNSPLSRRGGPHGG
jgi:hypothetical protein